MPWWDTIVEHIKIVLIMLFGVYTGFFFGISVNGIGVIHTCIYVHIYVHSSWLTPASFGSRHDLTLVVRSQTKRQQSARSTKDQGLHSCHN